MKIELDRREGLPGVFQRKNGKVEIDAGRLHYRVLNNMVKGAVAEGSEEIVLDNISGQRYIGSGIRGKVDITVRGEPGNDLGAFMDGPHITVEHDARDGVGNTMNAGTIVVHGHAGDIVGRGMRGGKIFVRGGVGRRAANHMREHHNDFPLLVIGGGARDFLGEYMGGGLVVALGLGTGDEGRLTARHLGAGMQGGLIFIRGEVEENQLGREVTCAPATAEDIAALRPCIEEYVGYFGGDAESILASGFTRLRPKSPRSPSGLHSR